MAAPSLPYSTECVPDGCAGFANQVGLYSLTGAEEIGVAAGLYRTDNYLGAVFSANLIGLTFGVSASDRSFHILAWGIGGLGIAVTLLAALDGAIPWTAK